MPELRRLPPGETVRMFAADPAHLGFEEYDVVTQGSVSHHHWDRDGRMESFAAPFRYVWPAELDLMARLAACRYASAGTTGTALRSRVRAGATSRCGRSTRRPR